MALKMILSLKDNLTGAMNKPSKALKSLGKAATATGKQMTMGLTAPIVALGAAAVKSAIDWESSFAGVRKTVDATEAEFGLLEDSLRSMSNVIPINPNQLAGIAELGGQLGVVADQIPGFTDTIAKIGVSTNLAGEEAASALAKFINVTKRVAPAGMEMAEQTARIGSTIVELGNNLATTEADIVTFAGRIAGAGSIVGLSQDQILGLAGALSSLGINAEAGGTAISRVFLEMNTAVTSGGEELATWAATAGMSVEAFATLFEEDAAGALMAFLGGLDDITSSGGDVTLILEKLGLSSMRITDTLLRSSGATDLMAGALNMASSAYAENTALTEEANKRFATTESQMQLIKNNMLNVAITIGSTLLPAINDLIKKISPLVKSFTEWAEQNPKLVQVGIAMAGVTAVAGPLLMAIGALAGVFAALASPITLVVVAVAALAYAWATDFGGIQTTLTAFWENTAKPIFDKIVEWLADKIPDAIETLSGFWEDTLLPAIETVYNFINDNLVPLFTALADVGMAAVTLAITAMQGAWQNVLQPALESVWTWLSNIATMLSVTLGPVLKVFTDTILIKLTTAFDGLKAAIGWVVDKLEWLADAINSINLPPWLTPGSPTPFETGLVGIGNALNDLNNGPMAEFSNQMNKMATTTARSAASMLSDFSGLILQFADMFFVMGGDPNLERAQSVATTMTSIAGMFMKVIEAFDELANYQGVEGLGDAIEQIMREMHQSVNTAIGLAWTWWEAELERAHIVASLIGELVGLIVPALEAFAALDEWEVPTDLGDKLGNFAVQVGKVLKKFGELAKADADWVGLAKWAAEVGPAMKIVKGAVDAISAIADYAPAKNIVAKVQTLGKQINVIVTEFAKVAAWREEWPDLSDFASAVKDAVSPIKSAVDAMVAITDYAPVKNIVAKVEVLAKQIGTVVLAFKRVDAWREEWPDLTDFAKAATTAVGLIKGPIDALTALADYAPVQNLGEKITALAEQIGIVVLAFKKIAGWRKEWDSVGEFSENAKAAMELMKTALDAFAKMAEFGTEYLTPQKFIVFGDIVRFSMEMIAWVAYSVGPTVAKAAGDFAVYSKQVFDMMKSALEFLGDLNETALPEEAKVAAFIETLRGILGQFNVGAQVAASIARQAYNIGNTLAYAGSASGFGESIGITRGGATPQLPIPTMPWEGIIGAPPVYSGGGGGGGGGTAGGEWQAAIVELRDMYKEDRASGNDTLFTRSGFIRQFAEIFPDIVIEAGASY